jgi:hypothetical protein
MFGKKSRLNLLELRKQVLIAESEINRVLLLEEWRTMEEGVRGLVHRARSFGSIVSAAALLVTGLAAFRRSRKPIPVGEKPSLLQIVLKGAQLANSIWLAIRTRPG